LWPDPQSAALNRLTGLGEEELVNAIAVLIAFLVELGSALGFCPHSCRLFDDGNIAGVIC
jgi:hypothetical protein